VAPLGLGAALSAVLLVGGVTGRSLACIAVALAIGVTKRARCLGSFRRRFAPPALCST
jgi:hypothetical protein